jgi:chorismate dehydratase
MALKIGCVPYLNAEPLIWPLENGVIEHPHSIIRAVPSDLVTKLGDGDVDCALASVVAILDFPKLVPITDIAIASRGAVASVLLFHNDPIEKLETIWLDPASRTSNILVQILRDRASYTECNFILPENGDAPEIDLLPADTGRLIIGDEALRCVYGNNPASNYTDLGELWKEKTNHPITFAKWIARNGDIAAELKPLLIEARDWSLIHLASYISDLAVKYEFETEVVDRYLRTNITYMHGPRELAGEREFFTLAGNLINKREKDRDV